MSAYVVDKAAIDLLVKTAIAGCTRRKGVFDPFENMSARDNWFSFWAPGRGDRVTVVKNPDQSNEMTPSEFGQMLWDENRASVAYRYSEDAEVGEYAYSDPGFMLTIAEALQLSHGFEYQACEHPEWRESDAYHALVALREFCYKRMPGYSEANWSWNAEEVGRWGWDAYSVDKFEEALDA